MKSRILAAVIVFLAITACRGTFQLGLESSTPTLGASPSLTSPAAQATATPLPAGPTPQPTALTPTPILPTPLPQQTTATAYSGGSIVMAAGTTAGVVQGSLQPGQVTTYTIQAGQSQPLILIVNSPNKDVTLGLFGSNGSVLLSPSNKWTNWQGVLPRTDLYTIWVTGGAAAESYTLTVKAAQVVNFASGATSITLNGSTAKGYVFSYALNCSANQTMTASLNVPSSTAYLDIFGIASGPLLSSASKANTWTGILPQTQAYVIEVIPAAGQVVNYSLTVTVTSTAGNVQMASGATAAVVQGSLQPGQAVTYTLQAGQSQPMILIAKSPNSDVSLGVFEANGNVLLDPAKKWTKWQGLLPQSELYTIRLFGGATTENYSLTIKVPQLVYFSSGTNSITLSGTTVNGYVVSYAFNCSASQTLAASLNVPASVAYLDVFGLSSGTLLSSVNKATAWSGSLPKSEAYVVEVVPANGNVVGYSLTVSVH